MKKTLLALSFAVLISNLKLTANETTITIQTGKPDLSQILNKKNGIAALKIGAGITLLMSQPSYGTFKQIPTNLKEFLWPSPIWRVFGLSRLKYLWATKSLSAEYIARDLTFMGAIGGAGITLITSGLQDLERGTKERAYVKTTKQ